MMDQIRHGGNDGVEAFVTMATRCLERAGEEALVGWIEAAYDELPLADQKVLVCMALKALLKGSWSRAN